MLDTDLAELYGVQTKVLNQAVKRNIGRFPTDFLFKLTKDEKHELVTNCDRLSAVNPPRLTAYYRGGPTFLSATL